MTEKIAWQWIFRFSTQCSTWRAFWIKKFREVNFLTTALCVLLSQNIFYEEAITLVFPVFLQHKIRQFHEISSHIIYSNALFSKNISIFYNTSLEVSLFWFMKLFLLTTIHGISYDITQTSFSAYEKFLHQLMAVRMQSEVKVMTIVTDDMFLLYKVKS